MQIVRRADEVETAYTMARAEAKASFRNDMVYMEKFLERPRHIEVQVFADGQGGAGPHEDCGHPIPLVREMAQLVGNTE